MRASQGAPRLHVQPARPAGHAIGSAGLASEHVAASLGHASFALTAKHYADGSAIADRKTLDATGTLFGGKPTVAEHVRLAGFLSPSARDELRTALTI